MHTVRMTLNVNEELLAEVIETHPGMTKTALVEQGLRALLAREAAARLADAGGTGKGVRRAKRSAWTRR
jgi:Arc/MetJ family transcription regulator